MTGMFDARLFRMRLKLEEFIAYQRAVAFNCSVTALLQRPAFYKNLKLRRQIEDANDSIVANFCEGYEQPTDRAFANYIYISKGSAAEVIARLRSARQRRQITEAELIEHVKLGEEVCRLLGGLARYLRISDFKDRGRHGFSPPADSASDLCDDPPETQD